MFVSCSDDDDGPETVSVWKATETEDDETVTYTATFYDDDTFEFYIYSEDYKEGYTLATGTYTGDTTQQNATIRFVIKKAMAALVSGTESTDLVDCSSKGLYAKAKIENNKMTLLDANTGSELEVVLTKQ